MLEAHPWTDDDRKLLAKMANDSVDSNGDFEEEYGENTADLGTILSRISALYDALKTVESRSAFVARAEKAESVWSIGRSSWSKTVVVLKLYFKVLYSLNYITKHLVGSVDDLLKAFPASDDGKLVALHQALTGLPFGISVPVSRKIPEVMQRLERALYGLDPVKRAIRLELVLSAHATGPANPTPLLLVGPPGVGKTAVAEAIAEALGLPFVRISLAGHCDIPALKGSAYTWNSSGIGYLAQALIAAGAENLVMLLDEADKSGGYANSTVSNLYAEILDPDQAHRYQDLFLPGLEIDLSQVQFVLTANDIRAVPDFATNRCKVIRLRSYTADERLTIIRDFFPQQIVGARRLGFTIFVAPDIARRLAAEAESLREARRMLTEMVAWAIEQKEPGSFESLTIDTWDDCVLDADGDSGQQIGFRP